VLGTIDTAGLAGIVDTLDRHGFVQFDARLGAADVATLRQAALESEATIRGGSRARFDPHAPRGVRYDFEEAFIASLAPVQALLMDPSLLAVAGAYLEAEPVNDLVAMWWSAATGAAPNSAAAQLFHFDLDRLKFLKFFFYLTDVDLETGPHCYIDGSHRDKPAALRHDGRKSDELVAKHYGAHRVREITGPAGTILAVDTRGFHKGKPLVRGHRLMLQLEYAGNLFGSPTRQIQLDERASPAFRRFVADHPRMFSRFIV
jgi:hypothetical protein